MQPDHSKIDDMEEAELLRRLENEVKHKDYGFNPDKKIVAGLVRAMVKKKEKTGEYYCPCRVVTGDPEEDARIICPCYYHEFEIERDGHCHCMLFVKPKAAGK